MLAEDNDVILIWSRVVQKINTYPLNVYFTEAYSNTAKYLKPHLIVLG